MKTKQNSTKSECEEKIDNMPDLMTLIENTDFDPLACCDVDCPDCDGTGIGKRSQLPCECVQMYVAKKIIESLQEEFNWIFEAYLKK